MKISFLFFFILMFKLTSYGQLKKYEIKGEIANSEISKYAYVCVYETNDKWKFQKTPIIDRKFSFNVEVNDSGYLSYSGRIFLTNDTLKEASEIYQGTNYRMLIIDNFSILIDDEQNVKSSKIHESQLNKEFDEMNKAIKEEEYIKFFESHQNSVMSIKMLTILIAADHMLGFGLDEYRRVFSTLSDRVQKSLEGKKVADKLSL